MISTSHVKKKVSIIVPPTNVRIISSRDKKDRRDRARTLSVKSLSTISESDSENHTRLELRKLRYSTLLGLPSGFTLDADPYSILNHSEWNNDGRINRETKSLYGRRKDVQRINDAVPILSFRVAVLCLIGNVLFPGLGTFISAFSALLFPRNAFMRKRRWKFFGWNVVIGFTQIIGVIYLLTGYVWGVVWGVYMVQLSDRGATQKERDAPILTKKVNRTLKKTSFWKKQDTGAEQEKSEDDGVIENLTRVV